jgi:hypothetical protein
MTNAKILNPSSRFMEKNGIQTKSVKEHSVRQVSLQTGKTRHALSLSLQERQSNHNEKEKTEAHKGYRHLDIFEHIIKVWVESVALKSCLNSPQAHTAHARSESHFCSSVYFSGSCRSFAKAGPKSVKPRTESEAIWQASSTFTEASSCLLSGWASHGLKVVIPPQVSAETSSGKTCCSSGDEYRVMPQLVSAMRLSS